MITEDPLEQLAIQWFQDTGWNYVNGAVIAPEGVAAEREDFRVVARRQWGHQWGHQWGQASRINI